ncbi:hypothetical protein KKG61_06535 [bacterium]|nr:hypothetical protein [bacterium]
MQDTIKQDTAIFWDITNDSGQKVSSGLYFIKLKAGKYSVQTKVSDSEISIIGLWKILQGQ